MTGSDSSFHTRNSSQETTNSVNSGASYQLILEHILQYPGTYEIPLRTMYTLNCAGRGQPTPSNSRSASAAATPSTSPTTSRFPPTEMHDANTQFATSLMAQISQLPQQPCSLPPTFITMFLKRCFTQEVHWVDFPQALTALDYLKDLESRRRKEVASSLSRLGINRETLAADANAMSIQYPGAAEWIRELETKDKRADSLYTQLFIALRRWVLINEMSLLPFNKHNCIAMLNTLYPPVTVSNPTTKLTPTILSKQRDGFFKYIKAVETRGTGVLMTLQRQGAAEGESNGWPDVHRNLEKYLRLCNSTIAECKDITNNDEKQDAHKTPRKTDSGVSFNSSIRPSSRSSSAHTTSRRPSIASTSVFEAPKSPMTPRKVGSALERIARDLIRLRKGKPEVEEIFKTPGKTEKEPKAKGLKKMKSFGALSELKHSNASTATVSSRFGRKNAPYDKDAMRRERLAYEEEVGNERVRLGYGIRR
ncbi:hypothetical protein NA57DRAFT_34615 [Rhizodiscina lignyota]|uniref:Uncharacterized protein n=1 Tax=Rhizodiscina lignyota TaxID=1504668 RepID=A0A9P4II18_9PEZI|nr:hypothetical protein NA57DRAFT_34615 [Rhizodiscina lignyota]